MQSDLWIILAVTCKYSKTAWNDKLWQGDVNCQSYARFNRQIPLCKKNYVAIHLSIHLLEVAYILCPKHHMYSVRPHTSERAQNSTESRRISLAYLVNISRVNRRTLLNSCRWWQKYRAKNSAIMHFENIVAARASDNYNSRDWNFITISRFRLAPWHKQKFGKNFVPF